MRTTWETGCEDDLLGIPPWDGKVAVRACVGVRVCARMCAGTVSLTWSQIHASLAGCFKPQRAWRMLLCGSLVVQIEGRVLVWGGRGGGRDTSLLFLALPLLEIRESPSLEGCECISSAPMHFLVDARKRLSACKRLSPL